MLKLIVLSATLLGSVLSTTRCLADTDWCTADPLPPDAIKFGDTKARGKNQWVRWDFKRSNLPTKVWCFVSDDHGASGQCKGLSTHENVNTECPPLSWVVRHIDVSPLPDYLSLKFKNQHSSDWRYFAVYYK